MLCSFIKVTFGGSILVDFSHQSEFEPRLSGHQRMVETVGAIRSETSVSFAHKNITNTIEFSRVENHGNSWNATQQVFILPQSWPTTKNDCTIEVRGHNGLSLYAIQLKGAVISAAPGYVRHRRTYHTITLTGGAIVAIGQGP